MSEPFDVIMAAYTAANSALRDIDALVEPVKDKTAKTDPPAQLPAGEVVVLQPYGTLFFAAAPVLESQLPAPAAISVNSVVILRLRGRTGRALPVGCHRLLLLRIV